MANKKYKNVKRCLVDNVSKDVGGGSAGGVVEVESLPETGELFKIYKVRMEVADDDTLKFKRLIKGSNSGYGRLFIDDKSLDCIELNNNNPIPAFYNTINKEFQTYSSSSAPYVVNTNENLENLPFEMPINMYSSPYVGLNDLALLHIVNSENELPTKKSELFNLYKDYINKCAANDYAKIYIMIKTSDTINKIYNYNFINDGSDEDINYSEMYYENNIPVKHTFKEVILMESQFCVYIPNSTKEIYRYYLWNGIFYDIIKDEDI